MFDQNSLSAACEVLVMEKPAAAAIDVTDGGNELPGWRRACAVAAAATAGGTKAAMAGDNRGQIVALLRGLSASRGRVAAREEAPFTSGEHRMFARHGLDPQRLRFMKTLSGFRQGMNLEQRLLEQALGGKLSPGAPVEESLEQYA